MEKHTQVHIEEKKDARVCVHVCVFVWKRELWSTQYDSNSQEIGWGSLDL